ncbi:MAG: FeoB-associated Cys-rich membrane protein [Thermoguttaceae bacterium]|nr:FeoB-associated Cys-rich membrane protein [Thermoguttaceae bacterium]
MIEKLIVALIVLTAGVLTVRSFLKSIRSGKCPSCKNCAFDRHDPENHCGCGHGGCGHGGCGHGGCGCRKD